VIGSTLGADGAGEYFSDGAHDPVSNTQLLGIVVAAYDDGDELLSKRVFLVPTRGWESDPLAPEGP